VTYSSPPSGKDLASGLRGLDADKRTAIILLARYANVTRDEAAELYRRADPVNENEARAICKLAGVHPQTAFSIREKIGALRKMTTAAGCTPEEASTAAHLADVLEAKD